MTLKEFYDEINGNYDEVMYRLKKEERVIKFLGMFLRDKSFEQLSQSIEQKNVESAFRVAHNMKGVCSNLSLTHLTSIASDITEMLRDGKDFDGACVMFPQLEKEYKKTVEGINSVI